MSRAFGLLSRENWTEAALDELVRQELAPFDLKRIAIKGPNINLKPRQSLSIGMLVHEERRSPHVPKRQAHQRLLENRS
jgi:two-component system CheB/CheR fusion protein